jgi:hypothetical protein
MEPAPVSRRDPPPFHSILVDGPANGIDTDRPEAPAFFADLRLDQVLAAMTAGRDEYDLAPFFYAPVRDVAAVRYRQEVLRDLESDAILEPVSAFARGMRRMRRQLAEASKRQYKRQQQRWFLDAVATYCDSVRSLVQGLAPLQIGSRALTAFRDYITAHAASGGFASLAESTRALHAALAGVRYCVHIRDNRVSVTRYAAEADYSAEVEEVFAKFKRGAVQDHRVSLPDWPDMNHVEAWVLDGVARLYPDVFEALDGYCAGNGAYLDPTIGAFDREVQFYLAYLDYIARFKAAGLPFCYPQVSAESKEVDAREAFDLALATKLVPEGSPVVRNDFHLDGPERILVVTGPNQGGKTTFARMFGQLHYLASLGLPVPGTAATLHLPDRLFTHFEREEDLTTLRGKLDDELVRIHAILRQATSRSVLIMNESFTSTTLRDSLLLGTSVLRQLIELDVLCVYVTFVDELASLSPATVSMVSTIVPDDPASRTYKIIRKPADGLAYAAALAEKYGLTYPSLRRRVAR